MAAKNAPHREESKPAASPRSSTDQPSRNSTDRPSMEKEHVEAKVEVQPKDASKPTEPETVVDVEKPATPELEPQASSKEPENETAESTRPIELPGPTEQPEPEATPTDIPDDESQPKEDAQPEPIVQAPEPEPQPIPEATTAPEQEPEAPQTPEVDEEKARQQEEIQEYVERIDSLQAKLQYLAKTAADAAKKAAGSAPAGSNERKLAEKDEKIALLLEEGRKLSNTEQKYRAAIRKLRTQLMENEKQVEELKKSNQKAASEAESLKSRFSTEEKEKLQDEARKASAVLQKEIDSLKRDGAAKDETIRRLERELRTNAEQAEIAKNEAINKLQNSEREKQKELKDTITSLQAEKDSITNKARLETIDLQEKLTRAVERSRTIETELKHELRAMESKLEAMRAAAEEASSGSGGEAQIKLLRQIETLQTQYGSASDNWQGIEASLLAKVANLEKERDEAQRRESEMRKKARDAVSLPAL